jgi:hypothetical protein
MQPTGLDPAYLRQCLDALAADPPLLRWRTRPREHFADEVAWRIWNKNYAGQTLRPQADGRLRATLTLDNGERRSFDARAIVAEIGVTPIGDLQRIHGSAPNDRFADMRALAGTGPLAAVMADAQASTGRSLEDLSVMSDDADPYRIDTAGKRAMGQWFADQVARFVAPDRRIHVRGVFYAVVAAGNVARPDGDLFVNDAANEFWLNQAARYARWLGYVDFTRLVDNKNDAPVVREAPFSSPASAQMFAGQIETAGLDPDKLAIWAGLPFFTARQPYRLAFFGEKTSLEDVLGPLAEAFGADLYLTGGQISDTLLHRMAADADRDGRPLVAFTFSDCDPAGYWDMPSAIGRKLQALRDFLFPDLAFTVVHAELSPDQARTLGLPSSPLKEGEKRGDDWLTLYRLEQTEIDALATLQPQTLERLAREAVAPYYDSGLARRVNQVGNEWRMRARAEVDAQVDSDSLDALKDAPATPLRKSRRSTPRSRFCATRSRSTCPRRICRKPIWMRSIRRRTKREAGS